MVSEILASVLNELPNLGIPYITEIGNFLRNASPLVLMVVGGLMYLFAGTLKGIVKLIGAGLFIYGLISVL